MHVECSTIDSFARTLSRVGAAALGPSPLIESGEFTHAHRIGNACVERCWRSDSLQVFCVDVALPLEPTGDTLSHVEDEVVQFTPRGATQNFQSNGA